VTEFGPEGIRRSDLYGLDRLDDAWARFEELHPEPLSSSPT